MITKKVLIPLLRCRNTKLPACVSQIYDFPGVQNTEKNYYFTLNYQNIKKKSWVKIGVLAGALGISSFITYKWHHSDSDNRSKLYDSFEKHISNEESKLNAEETNKSKDNLHSDHNLKSSGHVPYLIVGSGTAALAASQAIRARNHTAKIVMIGNDPHKPYMRPPLSKELWYSDYFEADDFRFKQWNGKERSIYFEKDNYYCSLEDLMMKEDGGVALIRNETVTHLDIQGRTAYLGRGDQITFEKCLIATGGHPKPLPCLQDAPNEILEKVTYFRTLEDFKKLKSLSSEAKHVLVVGGGFLGSELANAFMYTGREKGLQVTQVCKEGGIMAKIFPHYLSLWATRQMKYNGVQIISSSSISSLELKDGQLLARLNTNEEGIKPSTDLAKHSGLETDETQGGILANAELEVRSDVWVAGDVLSFYNPYFGRYRSEHHDNAVVSGRTAGENMTGSEISCEAVGKVDASLQTVGFFAKDKEIETEDVSTEPHEGFSKGVVFYLKDGRILGILLWNIFNQLSLARKIISKRYTIDDLDELAKLFHIYETQSS